jgi:hypothetical protein
MAMMFGGFGQRLTAEAGMNRFIWNMRYPDALRVPSAVLWMGMLNGPTAVPGVYKVKLTVGDKTWTQSWEWKKDPRLSTTQEDFQKQFDLLIQIRDKMTEVNKSIIRLRDITKQIDGLLSKVKGSSGGEGIIKAGRNIKKKLKEIEDVLIQSKSKSSQDPLNYPILLDNKIAALTFVVASADARPTDQSYEIFEYFSKKADEQLNKLKSVETTNLPALNKLVQESGIPAIILK